MFLLVFASYVSISVTLSGPQTGNYCCLVTNSSEPLNYSAYQITNASGEIDVLFDFWSNSSSGSMNMTPDYGPIQLNSSGSEYSTCGLLIACNGITITSSQTEINYGPSLNVSIVYTISITNSSQAKGYYLLFLPGECGDYLFIIVGNQIPSKLPLLIFTCVRSDSSNPSLSTLVMGVENMTGLNIPLSNP